MILLGAGDPRREAQAPGDFEPAAHRLPHDGLRSRVPVEAPRRFLAVRRRPSYPCWACSSRRRSSALRFASPETRSAHPPRPPSTAGRAACAGSGSATRSGGPPPSRACASRPRRACERSPRARSTDRAAARCARRSRAGARRPDRRVRRLDEEMARMGLSPARDVAGTLRALARLAHLGIEPR